MLRRASVTSLLSSGVVALAEIIDQQGNDDVGINVRELPTPRRKRREEPAGDGPAEGTAVGVSDPLPRQRLVRSGLSFTTSPDQGQKNRTVSTQ